MHIVVYHAVQLIKDLPGHSLGLYMQQGFEAANGEVKYFLYFYCS
jgi:hypothetical protein